MKDLTNRRFAWLIVEKRAANKDGRVAWTCRCDCGCEIVAKAKDLVAGRQTSCGCQWKKRGVEQLHYIDGTCIEMLESKTVRSNSHSGVTGVYHDKKSNKWRAEIMMQGKRHYLGRFDTMAEAENARVRAKTELFTAFAALHLA